ncbi:MAG TPA: hypothetical protein ENH33_09070, partial [Actinobacteria bacterium]|nr:hypothetical protein [Actinomycetota bacterium]
MAIGLLVGLLPIPGGLSRPAWAHLSTHSLVMEAAGSSFESQVVERPFTLVGLTWTGRTPKHIWARTRTDGVWSLWRELELDDGHAPDLDTAEFRGQRFATPPVWAGTSDAVQFRTSERPRQAAVTLVDTTERSKPLFRRLADLLTTPSSEAAPSKPFIHPRTDWDPTDSCRPSNPAPVGYVQVTMAFVHHSAGWNTYTQAEVPSYILGICSYHVNTRGWNDIGYNFIVDRFGGVWEGRKGGIEKGVQGAHTQGFNSYSTGVVLLGSFQNTGYLPSQAAQDSLVDLLAWKFSIHNIDPLGTTTVVSKGSLKYPQGTRVTLNDISGHRDAQATACPGDDLYVLLPEIRQRVAALWQPIPPDTYVHPLIGDFTGDGIEDGAAFRPADGTWWVTNGAAPTSPPRIWADYTTDAGWTQQLGGDFNGDGRDDIANFWTPG